jgi:hypothetical protein
MNVSISWDQQSCAIELVIFYSEDFTQVTDIPRSHRSLRATSCLASKYQQPQMSSHSPPITTLFTNLTALEADAPDSRTDQRARRQQIEVACKSCQVRKGKCDGQRPCGWCRNRKKTCEYEAGLGETRTRARKRKYEDLKQEHRALLEIVDIAALRPDAGDILQQLKSGRGVRDLLGSLKEAKNIDEVEVEDEHIGLKAARYVRYHSRSGCDVLEERAVEWRRGVTGQGDINNVDGAGRGLSRHFYPDILWSEPGYE